MKVALRECNESDNWLRRLQNAKNISVEEYKVHHNQCAVLRRTLHKSVRTAEENLEEEERKKKRKKRNEWTMATIQIIN